MSFFKDIFSHKDENLNEIQTIHYENGSIYKGETLHGKANGKGKFYFNDGDTYEGEVLNNKKMVLEHITSVTV